MGNPTKELCHKLDEMGVEYDTSEDDTTIFYDIDGNRYTYNVNPESGWAQLYGYNLTPEQAIAVTVGGSDVSALRAKVEAQSDYIGKLRGEYKALDEQMERRCAEYRATIRKLKAELDAATVGAVTIEKAAERIEVLSGFAREYLHRYGMLMSMAGEDVTDEVLAMESVINEVCGRKVVDE